MPNSQLRHNVVLFVAPLVKNCAKLYTQEHRYLPSLGAAVAVTPVWLSITAAFPAKCAGPPYETTVIRDRAVLSWIMQIAFSALSQYGYVCYTNLAWNLSHGAFGLHTSCASEATLWTTVEALKVASYIHNLLLDLVHAALLVSCLRHSPGTLLRQCGSRLQFDNSWRCVRHGYWLLVVLV